MAGNQQKRGVCETSGDSCELDYTLGQALGGVGSAQIDRQATAVAIIAGQYYLPRSMHSKTHLLGLMSGDQEVNVPGPAQLSQLLGLLPSAPEEQIGRTATLQVTVLQVVFVDNLGVEVGHFCRRRQGMTQHNPIAQTHGQRLREQRIAHGLADLLGLHAIGLFQAGTQAADGVAVGPGNRFVEDLAKGVIAEQQMHTLGKVLLKAKGSLKQAEGETVLSGTLGLVEQLMENQMPLGIIGQGREPDDFVEVSLMAVQVASHNDFTRGGKLQELARAAAVGQIGLAALAVELNNSLMR